MFRNLIALAPKKKAGVAAAVATKAKANTAAKSKKKSPSPKKNKSAAKKNKVAAVTKQKDLVDNRLDQFAVDFISEDIKAALAEVVTADVKSFGFGVKKIAKKPVEAAVKSTENFDTVVTEEVAAPATIQITENDEACFTANTQNEEPSAEKVEAAIAECEAAEAEFEVARDAEEDLSALGTYSEEPTDNIAAIFEDNVAADNNQFEAEGLEIAPAEAEVEATIEATPVAAEPTAAASPAAETEEGISAASAPAAEESAAVPAPIEEESGFKNVL